MEDILAASQHDSNREDVYLESHLVERISIEFNQLQFYVSKSRGQALVEQVKPRINSITQILQQNLENMFMEGLQTSDEETLTRCLRTYITIDKVSDAEALFRRRQVEPFLSEFVNEGYMRQKGGSFAMYAKILEFKETKCRLLLSMLKAKSGQEPLKGYDFLVNSVWPEAVELLETRAPSIFAAGDPDKFHKEYNDAMEFLTSFEEQCESRQSVERLRSHPMYDRFIAKWSLPVYFQIRLQDIAGHMEKSLQHPWELCKRKSPYKTTLVATVDQCVRRCWQDGVFLTSLTHRFWKLTLQLLSRYNTWLTAVAGGQVTIEVEAESNVLKPPSRLESLKSDGRNSPMSRPESPVTVSDSRAPNVSELTTILADTFTLIDQVNEFYISHVCVLLSPPHDLTKLMAKSLADGMAAIERQLDVVKSLITTEVVNSIAGSLKQVSDIPRLYRRTNREVPSKPSTYIQNVTSSLTSFKDQETEQLPAAVVSELMGQILQSLNQMYEETTTELLLSVKKMEDSLKRLKRGKVSTNLVGNMTDDDKIRTQIHLDLQHLASQAVSLGVDIDSDTGYRKLKAEVEQALSSSSPAS